MVMSASSAAFLAENFAGTVSVFAGAPGTAKAPLTNAAFAGAAAFGARCCTSAAGGCCWAAARPMPAANASASALVRKRAYRMAVSFSSAPRGRYPAIPPCLVSGGRSADITAGAEVWFRAAGAAALIVDLGDDDAGRGIDQQQAVVDDHVSVRAHGRHRGGHRLGHRRERVSVADPRADGIGIGGAGGWIDDALARHRRRRNRLGHDPLPHDRPASAPLRNDRAIDRGALGGRERKRRRAHCRLIGARLVGGRLVGPRLVVARLVTRLIDPRPGHIRLINPGLRARRHRRGSERYRQACGADIRPHGDLLCQLLKRWLTPHAAATFLPGERAPTAKAPLRLRDVTWTPQPADIRDAGARKVHLAVSFFSNSV